MLLLALLPDLLAIARIFVALPDASLWLFYGMGAMWVCATVVVMLDRSGGASLAAFWSGIPAMVNVLSPSAPQATISATRAATTKDEDRECQPLTLAWT